MSLHLNLGCGHDLRAGYVNVDDGSMWSGSVPANCVQWDLNRVPWPFPNESTSEIFMNHVLEHLPDTGAVIREDGTWGGSRRLKFDDSFPPACVVHYTFPERVDARGKKLPPRTRTLFRNSCGLDFGSVRPGFLPPRSRLCSVCSFLHGTRRRPSPPIPRCQPETVLAALWTPRASVHWEPAHLHGSTRRPTHATDTVVVFVT